MNLLEISDFWSHVDISGPKDCWPWRGKTVGYGTFHIRSEKRTVPAHRVAFEITKGYVQKGNLVFHTCENKPCCNPAHLSQGTHREMLAAHAARERKRRSSSAKVDASHKAKADAPVSLNEKAAFVAMRHGLLPVAVIAERAGVSRATAFRWAKKSGVKPESKVQMENRLWQQALAEAKKGSC